jgi:hypothetical protein
LVIDFLVAAVLLAASVMAAVPDAPQSKDDSAFVITAQCDECGDSVTVTLMDSQGRRDGWRGEARVEEIPNCVRQIEMSEGTEAEVVSPMTLFSVRADSAQFILMFEAKGAGVTSVDAAGDGPGDRCGASVQTPVRAGHPGRWMVNLSRSGESCRTKITLLGSKKKRK